MSVKNKSFDIPYLSRGQAYTIKLEWLLQTTYGYLVKGLYGSSLAKLMNNITDVIYCH